MVIREAGWTASTGSSNGTAGWPADRREQALRRARRHAPVGDGVLLLFFSVFPLLLVFVTVLGIVLDGNPELRQDLLDSALAQIPVIG